MLKIFSFFLLFWLGAQAHAHDLRGPSADSAQESSPKKSQIDDVFLWKVSDQLKLSLKKEKELSEILKNSNQAKASLNLKIQDTIDSLSKIKEEKKRKLLLSEYRRQLKAHSDLNLKELDQLQKVLGEKDLAQYLVLKQEFAEKIKNLLIQEKSKTN